MLNRRQALLLTGAALMANKAYAGDGLSAKAAGFSMPLESDPHLRTFMQWPAIPDIYGSKKALADVRSRIALIANSIAKFEPVVLLARPEQFDEAKALIGPNVELWPIETQDLWCRDSGPTFVVNAKGELAASELNFNGWGNKQEHEDDGRIARRVSEKMGLRIFESGVVGEGGGVETDGAGTLFAHESCWVNPNRNRDDRDVIERKLLAALGAEKMIWAPGVKDADITDYHIDALARFIKPGVVLIQLPDKVADADPWSASAYETYDVLKSATDANGKKLEIIVLPDPKNIRSEKPDFVSCYANYYVCNGAVIGAEFGDDIADEKARSTLQQLYPGREIVSLNVDPIGEAGGGIHCSTQQQPLGKSAEL
jgi:agmatine deiminase